MRVDRLVESLGSRPLLTVQGEHAAEFRGISMRAGRGSVKNRHFLVPDEMWRPATRKKYLPDGVSAEAKIHEALSNGARGVICSNELQGSAVLEGQNVLFTDDTHSAFHRIVELIQKSLTRQKITAVTGSAGKSTTAAMVSHALSSLDVGRVYSQSGNRNLADHVLSQLSRSDRSRHTVVEVAGSAFHRFKEADFTVSPHVAILTSISEAHLDYLYDLESVARIKSDLFQKPPVGGTAVVNIDTPYSELVVQRAVDEGWRLVTYGEAEAAEIRLLSYSPASRKVVARVVDDRVEYFLGPRGKHMAMNSLAVIATLRAYDLFYWRDGVRSLSSFEPLEGRGISGDVKLANGVLVTLIDESYNANPASVKASLDMLSSWQVSEGQRRIAVLGDIMELADSSDRIHRGLSEAVLSAELDEVHLFGEHMQSLYDEVKDTGLSVHHWSDLSSMSEGILPRMRAGDVVLAKASGSTGLKDFVRTLKSG